MGVTGRIEAVSIASWGSVSPPIREVVPLKPAPIWFGFSLV